MAYATTKAEQARQIRSRSRYLQHYEEVSRNVCQTCRFFGISRTQFYIWKRRYQEAGLEGLKDRAPGPRVSPFRIPAPIEALILEVRRTR